MSQPNTTLDHVQAFRSVHKSLPASTISAPLDSVDIILIDCHTDPDTKKDFILWGDIQEAFHKALSVRDKTKVISDLKGPDYRPLEPRRIAAVPGVVLDVVVGGDPPPHSRSALQQIQQHSTQYPKYDPISTLNTPPRVTIPRPTNREQPKVMLTQQALAKQVAHKRAKEIIRKIFAEVNLENLHASGDGSPEDFFNALRCFLTAISKGRSHALFSVGNLYISGQVPQDPSMAMTWYLRAAAEGHVEAQLKVAEAYDKGSDGVSQDHRQAFHWVLKAANQGHSDAQFALGDRYNYGDGVERDRQSAMDWYLKAADQDNAQAQFIIGVLYFQDKRFEQLLHLDKGDSDSVKADNVIPKSNAKALEWFLRAAHQGLADAQFGVYSAMRLVHSSNNPETKRTAMDWCRKAANQNHGPAQVHMGIFRMSRADVLQDEPSAYEWCLKAVGRSRGYAEYVLGCLDDQSDGVQQGKSMAFEWYLKSAEQGEINGQCEVAWRYEYGKGVLADREKAIEWYTIAHKNGHSRARNELDRLSIIAK
ncbi:hypothetical protein EC991_007698 [Linnemannia zychae]|nr:hypothetical protein EC991_007698 [Linnemannia zychae]